MDAPRCQDQGTVRLTGGAGARTDSAEPSHGEEWARGRLEGVGLGGEQGGLGPRPAGYVAPLSQAQRCLSPAGAIELENPELIGKGGFGSVFRAHLRVGA